MRTPVQLSLAVALMLAALAALAGGATGASLGFEPSAIRQTSRGLMTFGGAFGIGWRCNLTLGGSLHRGLINKVERTLIGFITEAQQPSCSQGSVTILSATLPWHLRYISISGTLPERVTSITLEMTGVNFEFSGCLVGNGSPRFSAAMTAIGGNRYTAAALTSNRTALTTNCFGTTGTLIGTFNLEPTLSITRN